MEPIERIEAEVSKVFTPKARAALRSIDVQPIEPGEVPSALFRLRVGGALSYVPFATVDGSAMAIHLWPGRSVERSPIYSLPHGERSAAFVCGTLADLPVGLWLWVARYYKERPETLRAALTDLAASLLGGRAIPAPLWTLLDESPEFEPTWWSADADPTTRRAWELGAVGHPFVGVPDLSAIEEAKEALQILKGHVETHPGAAPEIVAALLAAQAMEGKRQAVDQVLRVLGAEAERGDKTIFEGGWRETGEGLSEWDVTLRNLRSPKKVLKGTAFEPLARDLHAYSASTAEGVALVRGVAERLGATGDFAGMLRQLRNAAWLEAMSSGEDSEELCEAVAECADRVVPDSLAAALARACAATPASAV